VPRGRAKPFSFPWKTLLAFLILGLGAFSLLAERRISPLLAGDLSGAYPTRLFSAPFRIRPGDDLGERELARRLEILGYREAPSQAQLKRGEFSRDASLFRISLRGFTAPLSRFSPLCVEVEISGGRVASTVLQGTRSPLVEALLEPRLIYEISGPRRIRRERLESSEIPKAMADAVVAVEDRRFYSHGGVDPRGLLRAAWRDLRSRRLAEGGSTLTQQLARSLFLSGRRTLRRKAEEILIALYIDARFPKGEILRMYLDTVYFGVDGPVSLLGLKAAARHYFDKIPQSLTLSESALLAGLLSSPYRYDPFRDPEASAKRRGAVLDAMAREGFISKAEAARASREPVRPMRPSGSRPPPPDTFVAFVQRQLEQRYGGEALPARGLSVHTTQDPFLQEAAARALSKAPRQGALAALDPKTGAVRALVGSVDFSASPFDRATIARRQPGSAFKPFLYAAALSPDQPARRWTAASLLQDVPRSYGPKGSSWRPRNPDGRALGRVSLRFAFAQSLNCAAAGLASEVGPRRIAEIARRLGIESPLREELGLALGSSEVTLLELTGAYCPFANGGSRVRPYAVEAVTAAGGDLLEYHAYSPSQVLSPEEAFLMADLLREAARTGTAKALARTGIDAAGKTGTTNDGKDAWFVGFTPRLAAGVWTGSDTPAKLHLSGAKDALPIWADFILQASTGPTPAAWPRPPGILEAEVDLESGLRVQSGCTNRRVEKFIEGTEPRENCPLHPGGASGWLRRVLRPGSKRKTEVIP
jgi:penicillin-binding protein 1B